MHAEALSLWDSISLQQPEHPNVQFGIATALANLGHDGVAMQILMRGLNINPECQDLWIQMAACLRRQQDVDAAKHCYNELLKVELSPEQQLHTYTGLAGCYVNMGEPEKVIEWANAALAINPDFIHARHAKALGLLEAGRWAEGWKWYAERSKTPKYHIRDYGSIPQWDGKEKVKTLVVHAEQGLGDEIIFASCLDEVRPFADRVVGECNERLIELFARSFPWVKWYPTHERLMQAETEIDAWYRMGDLPGLFRPEPKSCKGTAFLKADPVKVAGYKARLKALGPTPYIGLAWAGGTKETHEKVRNSGLDQWKNLAAKAPGTVISVQYKNGDELGLPFWPAAIADLDEFAALLFALDVVVSCCQTAVHFAGGLGVPCIVATPSKVAWRYGQTGEKMPWYSSVKLVRQIGDDWKPVFNKIGDELADLGRLQAA